MKLRPVIIGSWTCRSGNSCDVVFSRDAAGHPRVEFRWDVPPPLSLQDQADYDAVILPDVVQRLQEYVEQPGRALVVRV